MLHKYAASKQLHEAVKLARFADNLGLWTTLAVMAASAGDLDTAETAFAAIDEADKVVHLQAVRAIPSAEGRAAALALFCHQVWSIFSFLLLID